MTGISRSDHSRHPCFNVGACRTSARMHLPIAPQCNLQCRYCSRKYDCVNESRPGVTSGLITEQEVIPAVEKALLKYPIHVIGIAGPGDPLATPDRTFRVLRLLKKKWPEMILCLSTNGLALADTADEILDLGLEYLTVTVNAVNPEIGAKIYEYVEGPGGILHGTEAAQYLIGQQAKGLEKLAGKGIHIKINTVCIPEINMMHIPEVSGYAAAHGAELHNILPLIPVPGTSMENMRPPSAAELAYARSESKKNIPVMTHCNQCRADAVGFLHVKDGGMKSIAIYGKGGVGKTTIAGSLAAYFQGEGEKAALIGCSPKSDSTFFLLGDYCRPTVLEQIKSGDVTPSGLDACLHYDSRGIACLETGGPEPAAGCAGRGISFALRTIRQTKLLERADITFPIYDVIADVVCGGFSDPFRSGYASRIYLVTTAEMMSLYAINNICRAVTAMKNRGAQIGIGGIIQSCRNIPDEKAIVQRFSDLTGVPVVGVIPFDQRMNEETQDHGKLIEYDPQSDFSVSIAGLAERIRREEAFDFRPIDPERAISIIAEIIAGKPLNFAQARLVPAEIPVEPALVPQENHRIAIYGKGGVGKSTISSNLSAALALRGEKVIQVGCDPKHDSVALLTHGMIPTVLDSMARPLDKRTQFIYRGFHDILCVESGGPDAGSGCAGQGVYSALEYLEKSDIFRKFSVTTSLFDVLGDVVCGGFAQPLRGGFCKEIYIVANGEPRSLLVVNNILKACVTMRSEGIDIGVAGLIHNIRNYKNETSVLSAYSRETGIPVIAEIPRSEKIQEAEMHQMTVIEYDPSDSVCNVFLQLADFVRSKPKIHIPHPLNDFKEILKLKA